MALEFSIEYAAENQYESNVENAVLQFLIIPEENDSQDVISVSLNNSLNIPFQYSTNAHGFRTLRIHPRIPFREIRLQAQFKVYKKDVNPFGFSLPEDTVAEHSRLQQLDFRADFEPFLRKTAFTDIPVGIENIFEFHPEKPLFTNLQELNHWVYLQLQFKPGVTTVTTTLKEILENKQGVCQDFTHLFCALARKHGVPSRYVSGYLHQGNGYFGDSQMHAWAEVYLPAAGWLGFDPTNDLLAGTNHIKVAHGKDYSDCAPLKGVIFAPGTNETTHTVVVSAQQ